MAHVAGGNAADPRELPHNVFNAFAGDRPASPFGEHGIRRGQFAIGVGQIDLAQELERYDALRLVSF